MSGDPAQDGSRCSQCGQPYTERACGPTHAIVAHENALGAALLAEAEPTP